MNAPATRPPVFLGCVGALAALALLGILIAGAAAFLESGADDGTVLIEDAGTFVRGEVRHYPERRFLLVLLPWGEFRALADMDTANRLAKGRRCRVAVIPAGPDQLALARRLGDRLSPAVDGLGLFLREECNGAVYDGTGARLDADGPNLDQYEVRRKPAGKVEVALRERLCTSREGPEMGLSRPCD